MKDWHFFEMIIRSTGMFLILLLFTRLMGRKQLSQLTFFNYITGIALGSIAANTILGDKSHLLNGLTSLVWWALLTIIVGFISLKSTKARTVVDGQPVIVIKRGSVLEGELRKLRLSIDDLRMLLREQQVFSMLDVEFAILEANGQLSVLLKEEKQTVTKKDQNIPSTQAKYVPIQLISDGKILNNNLDEAGVTLEWLKKQIKMQNVKVEDIFFAELQKDGTLYFDKRNDQQQ